jgi:hypothetical protein
MDSERLATGLGLFSIALGLAEIFAPGKLSRALGMEDKTRLVRAYGFREVGAAAAILSQAKQSPWLWSRVGGDGLDLATLGSALKRSNPKRRNAAIAFAMVAGITALDVLCARQLSGAGSKRKTN